MPDFKEFFDLRKLDEQQRGEIEFVLNSPAYIHSFRPYIMGVIRGMEHRVRDRSQARKDEMPDDFLFGGITFAEGLLKFFELLIEETSMERIHAAMENMTPEHLYEVKQQAGVLRPVLGVNQPAEPEKIRPEDDF